MQAAEIALNGERGALSNLANAGKSVARVVDKADDLRPLLTALDQVANDAAEAANLLERSLHNIGGDTNLQDIEERLFALRGVARKHNVQVDDLPKLCDDFNARLSLLVGNGDLLLQLGKVASAARAAFVKLAEELSAKRVKAAAQFEKAVMAELAPLKLDRAKVYDRGCIPPPRPSDD